MPDLLYEIGTEELPAGYLEPALAQLAEEIRRRLEENRLAAERIVTAGTPRRLAVSAQGIPALQPPVRTTVVGPPARAAFDADGKPTAAAHGFARSKGVTVDALQVQETEKGPYVAVVLEQPGRYAALVLPELLAQATAAIAFPKSMRWEKSGFLFARPIRSLVALLDADVLPLTIAGVEAGNLTYGHPFLAPGPVRLRNASFSDYVDVLREHFVVADVAERREMVRRGINTLLKRHGAEADDPELLEEVTNLVEWPHALEGSFDEHFLDVPAPVLIAAMKEHQRYFPVRDAQGRLAPHFVTVSNRTAGQDGLVREGNERVLLARLDDAEFFWEGDRRRGLEELVPRLKDVVFLAGLGNNMQRTERLVELAGRIAGRLGAHVSVERARRAAHLCKADLLTGLVGEFPSLQGIVGRELARAQGEPEAVALAIAEHYLPGGGQALPTTPEGSCLALADKLDVIVGCFALGMLPSGSQDPYALRRNALGILMITDKSGLELHLGELIAAAREVARAHGIRCDDEAAAKIREFFRDRLYNMALERGFRHDFVRAVLAAGFDDVAEFWKRLAALAECAQQPWWPRLVELVDRTFRIQRDADEIRPVRGELLRERLEVELAAALDTHRAEIEEMFRAGDYVAAAERYCEAFAQLVHSFFENVLVNVPDEDVRANRKSLCAHVYHLFADRFADLYVVED